MISRNVTHQPERGFLTEREVCRRLHLGRDAIPRYLRDQRREPVDDVAEGLERCWASWSVTVPGE